MPLDRLRRISRAAGLESTRGPEGRGQGDLIAANRDADRSLEPARIGIPHDASTARFSRPESCRSSSSNASRVAGWRAITTTSHDRPQSARARRNHSRIRRFTRFRATAFPTRRLAVMPSREGRSAPRMDVTMTKALDTARRPCCATCSYSLDRSRRSVRRKRPVATATATSRGSRRRSACGPWRGAASARSVPRACSSACESRVLASDGSGSAGTSASCAIQVATHHRRAPGLEGERQ